MAPSVDLTFILKLSTPGYIVPRPDFCDPSVSLNISARIAKGSGEVISGDDTVDLRVACDGVQQMFMTGPRTGDPTTKSKVRVVLVPPGTTYVRLYGLQHDSINIINYNIEVDYAVHIAKDACA